MLLLGNRNVIYSFLICEESIYLGDLENCFEWVKLVLIELYRKLISQ